MRRLLLAVLVVLALGASPAIARPYNSSSGGQRTVHVKTYTKKDGTVVEAHDRKAPTPKADAATSAPKDKAATPTRAATTTAGTVAHDSQGRILRSEAAKRAFEVSTGYPRGRPGYVVDHIVPLACGGQDDTSNMQWQTIAEGKAKDTWERAACK